jgi:hypothetical protein
VMVADPLTPDGDGLRYEREAPRIGSSLFYVDVPAGLSALTLSIEKDGGNALTFVTDPTGRMLPFSPYGSEIFHFDMEALAKREQHRTFANPVPGVWQFSFRSVEPRSEKDFGMVEDWSQPVPLKVRIQGWTDVTQHSGSMPASGVADARMQAAPGVLDALVEPLGLGVARDERATLRPGLDLMFFDVQIEPGSASLDLQIEQADPTAHVGLYVFKVPEGERIESTLTTDKTALVYYDVSVQQHKRYTLAAPPAGRYRVALDPISVRGGAVDVTYRELVKHPLFGAVRVNDGVASVDVRARPADGRRLYAEIGLFKRVSPNTPTLLARKGWFIE